MEEKDEIITPDENEETSSSEENKNSGAGSEADKTPPDKGQIPYDRFKDIIDEKNQLKETLETLKTEIELLKQRQPEPEEEPPADWQEAEKRTVEKAVSRLRKELTEKETQDRAEEIAIEAKFQQLSVLGEKITPEIKKSVLEKMIETGSDDVLGIYLAEKTKNTQIEKTELLKKEGFVPSSQRGGPAGGKSLNYKELRSRTLDDIIGG